MAMPSVPVSAPDNPLYIEEILENILLRVDQRTLLRAQGVNRFFYNCIQSSTSLQDRLFFRSITPPSSRGSDEADEGAAKWTINPLLRSPFIPLVARPGFRFNTDHGNDPGTLDQPLTIYTIVTSTCTIAVQERNGTRTYRTHVDNCSVDLSRDPQSNLCVIVADIATINAVNDGNVVHRQSVSHKNPLAAPAVSSLLPDPQAAAIAPSGKLFTQLAEICLPESPARSLSNPYKRPPYRYWCCFGLDESVCGGRQNVMPTKYIPIPLDVSSNLHRSRTRTRSASIYATDVSWRDMQITYPPITGFLVHARNSRLEYPRGTILGSSETIATVVFPLRPSSLLSVSGRTPSYSAAYFWEDGRRAMDRTRLDWSESEDGKTESGALHSIYYMQSPTGLTLGLLHDLAYHICAPQDESGTTKHPRATWVMYISSASSDATSGKALKKKCDLELIVSVGDAKTVAVERPVAQEDLLDPRVKAAYGDPER
ncbi:hypothetical protein BU16DRAFT_558156 [Lophium mytilinum]|uniref:F-box domain-containing protein n=1 Tax=Lophium mytilinum TaxID=390894 RepID=A0A6A6R554_9PEZI|nr:hypothetical protein BU16DRAFT_558156 [Lophium mytilinum]